MWDLQSQAARLQILGSYTTVRAFIAIELPEPIKQELDRSMGVLRSELDDGLIRWVRLELMHLTLNFIGEVKEGQIFSVQELLERVVAEYPVFTLEIAGFGCFPNSSRPRVVWAGIEQEDQELTQLQARLAARLETIGFEPESRDYHAHLTLGRVRKGLSGEEMDRLSRWTHKANLGTIGRFEVKSISLIRSSLQPAGAVHTSLHMVKLAS